MFELIGHFHPVIVHLPIGILLAALLLQWLSTKPKYAGVKTAIAPVLLAGVLSALASVITGLMLSKADDYDKTLVNWHMWFAFGVLIVSAVLYTKEVNPKVEISKKLLSVGLLILIAITGHLGGSLTHGSDYLTKPFTHVFDDADSPPLKTIKPLANVQEAMAYADVVRPIFETKCYSCHNANKRKGGLRMDDMVLLMRGGKNGKVIDLNYPDSSEMLKRMLLPVDNDDHMPPKEKPQPTESQVALIHWWIANKADFTKKVKDLPQPGNLKPVLLALQKSAESKAPSTMPARPVEKADIKTIEQLQQRDVLVLPIAQNTNYLEANFVNDTVVDKDDMELLLKLNKQLISVKMDNKKIAADAIRLMVKLDNLWRLSLAHTNITDDEMKYLKKLEQLRYLNLVGTNISGKGLELLSNLKFLQYMYLYQTKLSSTDFAMISAKFPKAIIDTGNYNVPLLPTDTTLVTMDKK